MSMDCKVTLIGLNPVEENEIISTIWGGNFPGKKIVFACDTVSLV